MEGEEFEYGCPRGCHNRDMCTDNESTCPYCDNEDGWGESGESDLEENDDEP